MQPKAKYSGLMKDARGLFENAKNNHKSSMFAKAMWCCLLNAVLDIESMPKQSHQTMNDSPQPHSSSKIIVISLKIWLRKVGPTY